MNWSGRREAHTDRRKDIETVLHEMVAALENDRYGELPALHDMLPPHYAVMVGPPRSRANDQ